MRAVGIKALRNELSAYVRLAAAGEVVLVTDRGRVIAELSRPRESRAEWIDDAELANAVREGWLTPPGSRFTRAPVGRQVAPLSELLQELDRDRSEG